MATPDDPGALDRTSTEEKEITFVSAAVSGTGSKTADQRCFKYRHVGELKSLYNGTKAVWRITVIREGVKKEAGTCFLGKFNVGLNTVHGLFTAYHVLGEEEIMNRDQYAIKITNRGLPLEEKRLDLSFQTIIENSVCFTCPLLDATFIEFSQSSLRALEQRHKGLEFLHVYSDWMGEVGSEFRVLHYPCEGDQYFSPGHLETHYGLHLFHSASTEKGSSGAPVMIVDGDRCNVVGIHTAQAKSCLQNYNVAVSTRSVMEARHRRGVLFHLLGTVQISHHPTREEMKSMKAEIQRKKLRLGFKNRDESVRIPSYFFHQGLQFSDTSVDAKPIYFVLTSHGWYWSVISPDDPEKEPNWAPATEKVFGHGNDKLEGAAVVEEPDGFTFEKLQSIQLPAAVEPPADNHLAKSLVNVKIE